MITSADYRILKELKKGRRLRESFEDADRINALLDAGYNEIEYGDKISDEAMYSLGKTAITISSSYQQFLKLTVKGRNALTEFQKTRTGKTLRVLFEVFLAIFSAILGAVLDHRFPDIIRFFESVLFR